MSIVCKPGMWTKGGYFSEVKEWVGVFKHLFTGVVCAHTILCALSSVFVYMHVSRYLHWHTKIGTETLHT